MVDVDEKQLQRLAELIMDMTEGRKVEAELVKGEGGKPLVGFWRIISSNAGWFIIKYWKKGLMGVAGLFSLIFLVGLFGGWVIASAFVSGGLYLAYTFLINKGERVYLIDCSHYKNAPDKFSVFSLSMRRWTKMEKEGESFPLHTKRGLAFFTEGVDFAKDKVMMAHRHYSNIAFNTKKELFPKMRDENIKVSTLADKYKLLLKYLVHKETRKNINSALDVVDEALFKPSGNGVNPEAQLKKLGKEITEIREEVEYRG